MVEQQYIDESEKIDSSTSGNLNITSMHRPTEQ
jgi:hypothetical protein